MTTDGATLSSTTILLACAAGLPAASLTLAVTVKLPLARPDAFTLAVHVPSLATTAVPTVGVTPSLTVKETVRPTTPELVPEIVKVSSSAALTLSSPASVASMARVGANISTACGVAAATMLGLLAASIAAPAAISTVTLPSKPSVGVTTKV